MCKYHFIDGSSHIKYAIEDDYERNNIHCAHRENTGIIGATEYVLVFT